MTTGTGDKPEVLIRNAFSEDGLLKPIIPGYEHRPEQAEMGQAVWQALSDGEILLVEAGTGVGKSVAYLFPAMLFTALTKRRVVISTNTINLQEQLVSKDLPSLNRFWQSSGVELKWDLVKGRGHYLCLRKFFRRYEEAARQTDLFQYTKPREDLIKRLKELVGNAAAASQLSPKPPRTAFGEKETGNDTQTVGELTDLRLEASEDAGDGTGAAVGLPDIGLEAQRSLEGAGDGIKTAASPPPVWNGDVDKLGFKVPPDLWSELSSNTESCMGSKCPHKSRCFYRLARASLGQCHILVVNHALLVSDLRLKVETKGASWLLPPYDVLIVDEAHHLEDVLRDHLGASISSWRLKRLADDTLREARSEPLSKFVGGKELDNLKRILGDASDLLERVLEGILRQVTSGDSERTRLREKGVIEKSLFDSLQTALAAISTWLNYDLTEEERFEVSSLKRRFSELSSDLDKFNDLAGDGEDRVYWVERGAGQTKVDALRSCPLEVSGYLQGNLWSGLQCAVLTSATLAVGKTEPFSYVKNALGLETVERVQELQLGSPFRFEEQACMCVPAGSRGYDPRDGAFLEYVAQVIPQIVDLTLGRCFVLFTSYRAMDTVVRKVKDSLESKGFPVLKQGDDSRETLIQRFKESGNGVLFGVDSFWEGVDVPGDALSCVVVTKLPFSVPDDPVVQARSELWRSQGRDPFSSYHVPKAALKLKQGFGRLIRTKSDRGAVVILDSRIVTKSYGKVLMESLPPAKRTTDLEEIAQSVNRP